MDEPFRIMTQDEFDRDWRPIRDAIFGEEIAGSVYSFIERPYHVGPSDWLQVAIPQQLFFPWGSERYWPEKSEGDFDEYAWLLRTLQERGGRPICTTEDFVGYSRHKLFQPSREALYWRQGPAYSCGVFDASGEWGLCDMWDRIGVLGGNQSFMEHYLRNVGGLETAIRHFHDFDIGTHGWDFMRKDDQPIIDAFYDTVGWPRPDYPPDQQVPNRKPPPER